MIDTEPLLMGSIFISAVSGNLGIGGLHDHVNIDIIMTKNKTVVIMQDFHLHCDWSCISGSTRYMIDKKPSCFFDRARLQFTACDNCSGRVRIIFPWQKYQFNIVLVVDCPEEWIIYIEIHFNKVKF